MLGSVGEVSLNDLVLEMKWDLGVDKILSYWGANLSWDYAEDGLSCLPSLQ